MDGAWDNGGSCIQWHCPWSTCQKEDHSTLTTIRPLAVLIISEKIGHFGSDVRQNSKMGCRFTSVMSEVLSRNSTCRCNWWYCLSGLWDLSWCRRSRCRGGHGRWLSMSRQLWNGWLKSCHDGREDHPWSRDWKRWWCRRVTCRCPFRCLQLVSWLAGCWCCSHSRRDDLAVC
jgi:hypothetical protein